MKKRCISLTLLLTLTTLFYSSVNAVCLRQGAIAFDIDPATLELSVDRNTVNLPQKPQIVSELHSSGDKAHWHWPARQMRVSAKLVGNDLQLSFTSERAQTLKWFTLPS